MGRYLLRRKALSLLAALLIPAVLPAAPEAEARERYASRRAPTEEDALPGPRQFHGGPRVFSPAFTLTKEAKIWLDRITASEQETEWILAALKRSTPYAHFIREKIEEYGLPPEIFYLPVVESLYKIGAHSRSGALGLWQFMSASASPWMKIDEWLDERKDFWKSTIAAMEKLSYNYTVTEDWLLALAAYNCGLGRVRRVMKESGLRDFWEISRLGLLPRETLSYIPRLIATAHFASSPGRLGIEQSWEPPVRWVRVQLEEAVDLRLLAGAAEISPQDLSMGNAELLYGITPAGGSYHLKVRAEDAPKVQEALAHSDGKLLKFVIHTIEAGHTLSEIALHYGIPVSMLQRYNPGTRPETLRIGSPLVVPLYRDAGPYVKKTAEASAGADGSSFKNEYTVRKGDSLWAIARSFGTTSAALAAANGIAETGVLQPGASLKVP
ncbi:MAG: LysM peptidoglycan-binding domain-containing protein [Spirochaetales bacterium]|jgi:membrane-bound lytic murein transglycosylase D|nr:LysM peptidoglycan-binding domain-containing protein [Spirochaetales bacterium]